MIKKCRQTIQAIGPWVFYACRILMILSFVMITLFFFLYAIEGDPFEDELLPFLFVFICPIIIAGQFMLLKRRRLGYIFIIGGVFLAAVVYLIEIISSGWSDEHILVVAVALLTLLPPFLWWKQTSKQGSELPNIKQIRYYTATVLWLLAQLAAMIVFLLEERLDDASGIILLFLLIAGINGCVLLLVRKQAGFYLTLACSALYASSMMMEYEETLLLVLFILYSFPCLLFLLQVYVPQKSSQKADAAQQMPPSLSFVRTENGIANADADTAADTIDNPVLAALGETFRWEEKGPEEIVLTEYIRTESHVTVPFWLADNLRVTTIGSSAFASHKTLASVVISPGVETVEDGAFKWCRALEEITLPASVSQIGENTFLGCPNLTILAPRKSAAWKYAKKQGLKVVEG